MSDPKSATQSTQASDEPPSTGTKAPRLEDVAPNRAQARLVMEILGPTLDAAMNVAEVSHTNLNRLRLASMLLAAIEGGMAMDPKGRHPEKTFEELLDGMVEHGNKVLAESRAIIRANGKRQVMEDAVAESKQAPLN